MGTVLMGAAIYDEAKQALVEKDGLKLLCDTLSKYLNKETRDEMVCQRCLQILSEVSEVTDYARRMVEEKVVEKSDSYFLLMRRKKRGFPWFGALFVIVVAVVLYRHYDLLELLYNQLLAKLS